MSLCGISIHHAFDTRSHPSGVRKCGVSAPPGYRRDVTVTISAADQMPPAPHVSVSPPGPAPSSSLSPPPPSPPSALAPSRPSSTPRATRVGRGPPLLSPTPSRDVLARTALARCVTPCQTSLAPPTDCLPRQAPAAAATQAAWKRPATGFGPGGGRRPCVRRG